MKKSLKASMILSDGLGHGTKSMTKGELEKCLSIRLNSIEKLEKKVDITDAEKNYMYYLKNRTQSEEKFLQEFKGIKVAFVYYDTCYSGGVKRAFVQQMLNNLDVNFIVCSYGIGDAPVAALLYQQKSGPGRLKTSPKSFFQKLRNFFTDKASNA